MREIKNIRFELKILSKFFLIFILLMTGSLLNVMVILRNGGQMPVILNYEDGALNIPLIEAVNNNKLYFYTYDKNQVSFWWASDWLYLPYFKDKMRFSIGDLLILIGLFNFIYWQGKYFLHKKNNKEVIA